MASTSALEQQRAARSGVAWRDLSDRTKIRVTGPDRVEFLHAVLSNEVRALPDFAGCYGALLTATGKIVADFDYYRFSEFFLLDVDGRRALRLTEALNGYIIMDDVTLEDETAGFSHLQIEGGQAPEFLVSLLGGPLPEALRRIVVVPWGESQLWLIRKNQLSEYGFEIILPSGLLPELRRRMKESGEASGLIEIGPDAFDILRLERGIPRYGVDFSERNNPIEVGLSEAYSLTKGCYPGQEVIAKATNIGGVARLLVKLRLVGKNIPKAGAKVFAEDGREIGRITSAVYSPRLQGVIGFASVKRAAADPGTKQHVEMEAKERIEGEVVESFS